MSLTISHNKSCGNDFKNEFLNEWNWAIKHYMDIWVQFYKYWIDQAREKKIPCLFIRYEDLAINPRPVMREVMEFMLGTESIDGTFIEQRIDKTLKDMSAGIVYSPRSGKVNSNLDNFNKEQYDFIK